jgi:hypothetical protein
MNYRQHLDLLLSFEQYFHFLVLIYDFYFDFKLKKNGNNLQKIH